MNTQEAEPIANVGSSEHAKDFKAAEGAAEGAAKGAAEKPAPAYTLKPRTKPLPSMKHAQAEKPLPLNEQAPGCRAENEDDDGYDPWSDRVETTPFFEESPWD